MSGLALSPCEAAVEAASRDPARLAEFKQSRRWFYGALLKKPRALHAVTGQRAETAITNRLTGQSRQQNRKPDFPECCPRPSFIICQSFRVGWDNEE